MSLILASSSSIRQAMLDAAGIAFDVIPARVDETMLKQGLLSAEAIASKLAAAKAVAVSAQYADAWVIGSDSVASVNGRLFDKPANRADAVDHLRFFSGRGLQLTSAVALARGGTVDWTHVDTAELHVRDLSDEFIHAYLDDEWPMVSHCVGVFRLEGRGVQLFERIDGNHFTILGMPLMSLLGALRERQVIRA